jgi:PEP-CTERM motif
MNRLRNWLAVLAGITLAGTQASASIIMGPGPDAFAITPVAGGFKWSYSVQVPGALNVQPGDSFTILDFRNLQPGSAFAPSDWTVSSSLTGPADAHHVISPPDDPAVPNLTWTYHGPSALRGNPAGVQLTLSGFGAVSAGGTPGDGLLYSFIHRDSDGKFVVGATPAVVPGKDVHDAPEPATLALLGVGLPLLGAVLLRRKKAAA